MASPCRGEAPYTALSFGKRLGEVGTIPSMGTSGTALKSATAWSFLATLKSELVHRRRFADQEEKEEEARSAIFEYPEGFAFYNRRRLYLALSYQGLLL